MSAGFVDRVKRGLTLGARSVADSQVLVAHQAAHEAANAARDALNQAQAAFLATYFSNDEKKFNTAKGELRTRHEAYEAKSRALDKAAADLDHYEKRGVEPGQEDKERGKIGVEKRRKETANILGDKIAGLTLGFWGRAALYLSWAWNSLFHSDAPYTKLLDLLLANPEQVDQALLDFADSGTYRTIHANMQANLTAKELGEMAQALEIPQIPPSSQARRGSEDFGGARDEKKAGSKVVKKADPKAVQTVKDQTAALEILKPFRETICAVKSGLSDRLFSLEGDSKASPVFKGLCEDEALSDQKESQKALKAVPAAVSLESGESIDNVVGACLQYYDGVQSALAKAYKAAHAEAVSSKHKFGSAEQKKYSSLSSHKLYPAQARVDSEIVSLFSKADQNPVIRAALRKHQELVDNLVGRVVNAATKAKLAKYTSDPGAIAKPAHRKRT